MASQDIQNMFEIFRAAGRSLSPSEPRDEQLGPLQLLPGTWRSAGHGWNMIALPFAKGDHSYRLLMNQYNEELTFSLVDKAVPNRGVSQNGAASQTDQFLVTLDYVQSVTQIAAEDSPESGEAGPPDLAIHHEPGLWLHMKNETVNDLDIARLATIPHGDSALALGTSAVLDGAPEIPDLNGLPIRFQDPNNPYLEPYKHFIDNPFFGTVPKSVSGFPGFNPLDLTALLKLANNGVNIVKTTKLEVDTTIQPAGVLNIPFITREANAASMKSTFWIQELADNEIRLQYLQVVNLDFLGIRWPHVSINTLDLDKNS